MTGVHTVLASDGVPVAVHELGGRGRPAVLVHANGFNAASLEALASGLGGTFECFAPDLRGHGASGIPPSLDFSWDGFARDVLATRDLIATQPRAVHALEPPAVGQGTSDGTSTAPRERPVGVGHSLGATALLLAEIARPGTFESIYCYEPVLIEADHRRPPGTPNRLSEAARRRRDVFASRAEALQRYASRPPLSTLDAGVLASYVEQGFEDLPDGTVRLRCMPESEALSFEAGYACDALDRLHEVRCPVTIAVGADSADEVVLRGAARGAERLPVASTVVLAGLGHFGPMQAPGAVATSVLEALAPCRGVTPRLLPG